MPRQAKPPTKSTAAPRKEVRIPGGPSTRPGGRPQKREHIERARRDVEGGLKDTDRRGVPSDVPTGRR